MRAIILLVFLVCGQSLFAGGEIGNGGDGVLINGRVYSLDLVEAGVELDPFFNNQVKADTRITNYLSKKFSHLPVVVELLSRKLNELYMKNPSLAYHVLTTINLYSWQFLNSRLINLPDDGDSVVNVPNGQLVQIAIRYKKEIKIDRSFWNEMDDINKASLILHEAFFALIQPHMIEDGKLAVQSSLDVRRTVGFIFSNDFDRERFLGFVESLETWEPYPFSWDLATPISPSKSAVMDSEGGKWIGDFYYQTAGENGRDGSWAWVDSQNLERFKKGFCRDSDIVKFRMELWVPDYKTHWSPDYYAHNLDPSKYPKEGFEMRNGFSSWLSWSQDIAKGATYEECMKNLSRWKAVDPLDRLELN